VGVEGSVKLEFTEATHPLPATAVAPSVETSLFWMIALALRVNQERRGKRAR
jgi:hypothetical protein